MKASGWGGRATADGNDVQNHIIGNCRITPIEVFETRFPVTVLSYELIPDSGGAGRFRGGLASRRVMRIDAGTPLEPAADPDSAIPAHLRNDPPTGRRKDDPWADEGT